MIQHSGTGALPAQPFFSTPQQRLALARQRYFDEGVRPSGLISEGVIQSWSRCVQARRTPVETVAFDPVTPSRVHSALARSRVLLAAASSHLLQLETTLSGTGCAAILTDPHGVVVHATRSAPNPNELLLPLARRVGVSLDEAHIGTGAPGVTLRTGQASLVLGAEHFFGHMQRLHCAAAPIRDVHGGLAAVLDLTIESRPFGFDAAAVVSVHATAIENALLRAQSTEHVVVQFQTGPGLLGTPLEGLAGIASDGTLAWLNGVGARLLGVVGPIALAGLRAGDVFGTTAAGLARLTREPAAVLHLLPSGLRVWLLARMQAPDGMNRVFGGTTGAPPPLAAVPTPPEADATLHDRDRHLVAESVRACGGNISKAARQLGVSRGLVYRHLKRAGRIG